MLYNILTMQNDRIIRPIAYIRSDFREKFGIPRQSGRAPSLTARVEFLPEYAVADAFRDIESFSHLWLLFEFSATREKGWSATVRPPRLGGNKRVGVFASRSPFRPNRIGLSCVKFVKTERTERGVALVVSGADLLDGTPIFDVKPYLPFTDCRTDATGGYAEAGEAHKLHVRFPQDLLGLIPEDKRAGLLECLADDPRPSYQNEPKRVYGMRFSEYEIKFSVEEDTLTVVRVELTD